MKKLAMALMSLLSLVFCASCSSEIEGLESGSATVQKQENKIRTKLNLTGEMLDVSTAPWTRSEDGEAKDWYAIQVYQTDSTVVTETQSDGSTKTYVSQRTTTPYAYGLFDDVSNLELDLVEGKTYRIQAVMIKEASDSIEYIKTGCWVGTEDDEATYLKEPTNSFVFSSNVYIPYNNLSTKGNGSYYWPQLEEFYGITENYSPKEGNSANVSMKRASFAVKLVAKDFTEGTITVKLGYLKMGGYEFYELYSPIITMTPEQPEVQKVISSLALISQDVKCDVQIVWTKSDGTKVTLGTTSIAFQRNTITTIKFSAKEAEASTITQKLSAITVQSEEWQEGKTIDIN